MLVKCELVAELESEVVVPSGLELPITPIRAEYSVELWAVDEERREDTFVEGAVV